MITITGQKVSVIDTGHSGDKMGEIGINALSSGLSTLPRLSDDRGGTEVTTVARRLASFRVFDVRVDAARRPSRFPRTDREVLDDDAANLAGFLLNLRSRDESAWEQPQPAGLDLRGGDRSWSASPGTRT